MKRICTLLFISLLYTFAYSQRAYFVDGYHGGIYGHYPVEWQTQFMTDRLAQHPEWRICLEIEPETWDSVRVKTPEAYHNFSKIVADKRIEFTNPTYAQPYCYNISGESLIRQFEYGIQKIHQHFPQIEFVTYSVEEPCFTSCLPQILKLFGFKYAVQKNPNTCWGGYTRPYGGELVNWIGPDGTSILTVPRYECEALENNSSWQTTAWANSEEFIESCFSRGIKHPVGMCFQDAGWKNGPWLGFGEKIKNKSIYTTWREYIEEISIGKTPDNWHFSQEDVLVNLMWGSQALQKIAQEVRTAENKIVIAEKLGTMAHLANRYCYSQESMDNAWRTLMLAQHHDSWIVPYNHLHKQRTWAEEITLWTDYTNHISDKIVGEALHSFVKEEQKESGDKQQGSIRVYNTLGVKRDELATLLLPERYADSEIGLRDIRNNDIACTTHKEGKKIRLVFKAEVPPFGYTTYRLSKKDSKVKKASGVKASGNNEWIVENDMYRIVVDASKGGTIKSLIAKQEGGKEFASSQSEFAINELRGHFYEEGKFHSSKEAPARISILKDNPMQTSVKIEGEIATHPFTQIITLAQGEKRIDFSLTVDWKRNVGIGEYKQQDKWTERRRAFCDDRFKLNVLFPVSLHAPRLFKNAPFDVCESKLDNTFFQSWDQIKHNVILHWIDLAEPGDEYGLALMSDHATSYSYGEDFPLGLTAQYSGTGLWGMNYQITAPLRMRYAILPHRGDWNKAAISTANDCWNEPLICSFQQSAAPMKKNSLIDVGSSGYQISAARITPKGVLLRLFNAEGDRSTQKVSFSFPVSRISETDLNGNVLRQVDIRKASGKTNLETAMPEFGIKTFIIE